MKRTLLLSIAVLGMSPMAVGAAPIIAQSAGLSGTDVFQDFGADLLPNFTPVSTEFAGLTIHHASYFTTGTSNNLVGGFLTNDFGAGLPNTLSIAFDQDITDLSFVYHQISTAADSVFRAMLDGVLVETFSNLSNQFQTNNFFGFTNIVFDELQIDFVADFNVDSLAYNFAESIPEPGSLSLLGIGLLLLGFFGRRRRP